MPRIKLPADPEGQNNDRAEWAEEAIEAFRIETGCDLDTAVYDLLCDLAHYCDRHGLSFADELSHAKKHYNDETAAYGKTRRKSGEQFDRVTVYA